MIGGNCPMGTEYSKDAPWNKEELPIETFDVCVSSTLSKAVYVNTNDYTLDDDYYDTFDTNWIEAYSNDGHYTPIQLIQLFKKYLQSNLDKVNLTKKTFYKHLIEECESWVEDELVITV